MSALALTEIVEFTSVVGNAGEIHNMSKLGCAAEVIEVIDVLNKLVSFNVMSIN
jgi:hypothetical protein